MANDCLQFILVGNTNNEKIPVLGSAYTIMNLQGETIGVGGIGISSADGKHVKLIANGTQLVDNTTTVAQWAQVGRDIGLINGVKIEFTNVYSLRSIEAVRLYNITDDFLNQLEYAFNLSIFKPVGEGYLRVFDNIIPFIESQFNNGRRSGQMTTSFKVHFNGVTVQSPTFVFGENDVKTYNTDKSVLLGTFDGTEWTYPSE